MRYEAYRNPANGAEQTACEISPVSHPVVQPAASGVDYQSDQACCRVELKSASDWDIAAFVAGHYSSKNTTGDCLMAWEEEPMNHIQ